MVAAARAVAHDGDAGFGQKVGGALGEVGRHGAERKGVAHRHPAVQAGRLGAVGDRRIWAMPLSPLSCRWMSMPTPRRSAMAKIASRWP